MLARSGRGIPVDLDDWAIEPKWDGWRCLARVNGGEVRLTSRWRHDLSSLFSELTDISNELAPRRLLLDGEIVALRPDGKQDFHALTQKRRRKNLRLAFMCFDLLHVDGHDLLGESYDTRRQELERLRMTQGRWLTTPSLRTEAGAALYGYMLTNGWEGVVAKRIDSTYRPASRDGAWLKAKHPHARDLHVDRSTWTMRDRLEEPRVAYDVGQGAEESRHTQVVPAVRFPDGLRLQLCKLCAQLAYFPEHVGDVGIVVLADFHAGCLPSRPVA